ncbi:hypothetical protein [Streptomyces sp. NPDC060194]|uniref:hypothetical protein n=1 Tax=Streptomyces sp. NPDC060194 TaxID=3347069 RepID=UPI00364A8BB0
MTTLCGGWRPAVATAFLAVLLTSCGASGSGGSTDRSPAAAAPSPAADRTRVPGVGDRWWKRIPADSRQLVVVRGAGVDSADSTVELWTRDGRTWSRERGWSGHNGRKGWTTAHRENDKRSPVGVFTLSDAGGVLPDPDGDPRAGLPYTRSASFAAPRYWKRPYWHDFDLVVAIDYNRVRGTSPADPTRPQGQGKGGSIWLHMDHGSGTSACVSLPKAGMEHLLRTLDPAKHPRVVMGDRAHLAADRGR